MALDVKFRGSGAATQLSGRITDLSEVGLFLATTKFVPLGKEVHLEFETSTESFSWVVLDGDGAYSDVHGSGSGSTVSDGSDPQTGNFNFYDGFLLD